MKSFFASDQIDCKFQVVCGHDVQIKSRPRPPAGCDEGLWDLNLRIQVSSALRDDHEDITRQLKEEVTAKDVKLQEVFHKPFLVAESRYSSKFHKL